MTCFICNQYNFCEFVNTHKINWIEYRYKPSLENLCKLLRIKLSEEFIAIIKKQVDLIILKN